MALIDPDAYLRQRRRFRAEGVIDADLYGLLRRLARVVVFGGRLAPAYSPTGRWDAEAIEEALHDWISSRLLQTNALLAAFDLAPHPRPFLASLEQNFRHHLENARERGELGNLIARTGELLREDPGFTDFIPRRRTSETWWGLSGWSEPDPWQGSDETLLSLAFSLGEVPIFRYSQSVERASPVLSTATLRQFLTDLLTAAGALLTIAHLAVLYRRRFDLGPPIAVELEGSEGEEVAGEEAEAPEEEWVAGAATALAAELSERQLGAILASHRGLTLEEIGAELGVSRGTADNALRSAGPLIDKHCVDGVTRGLILEKLLDSLS